MYVGNHVSHIDYTAPLAGCRTELLIEVDDRPTLSERCVKVQYLLVPVW